MTNTFQQILDDILDCGGTAYYVGGTVRDYIFGHSHKDIDMEVFGLSYRKLYKILNNHSDVSEVGKSFGILKAKIDGTEYDFSIPRRERKISEGHTGFEVTCDPNMSLYEALERRDFTINSMMLNAHELNKSSVPNLYDPFGGKKDLDLGVLKATSERFSEDPLRVLRAFQFISRFNLKIFDTDTVDMSRNLLEEYDTISVERIWIEWEKWALKSIKPSAGLQWLEYTNWIKMFGPLNSIIGVPQSPKWHPEGDVFVHTGHVCDEMVNIIKREGITDPKRRLILMFAALCHDFGKATATRYDEDKEQWTSKGHAKEGVPMVEEFFTLIGAPKWLIKPVQGLTQEHLAHAADKATPRMVRRLSKRLSDYNTNIQDLVLLIEADISGRPPLPRRCPQIAKDILSIAEDFEVVEKPQNPIITGKILKSLSLTPGPEYGIILNAAYNSQMEGHLDEKTEEEIIKFAKSLIVMHVGRKTWKEN